MTFLRWHTSAPYMQHDYDDMQHNYVNVRCYYVNMQRKLENEDCSVVIWLTFYSCPKRKLSSYPGTGDVCNGLCRRQEVFTHSEMLLKWLRKNLCWKAIGCPGFSESCNTSLGSTHFNSPELKAQLSFSDRLLSVFCPSVFPSVCTLFTLNKLGTNHPWMKGVHVCSNERWRPR